MTTDILVPIYGGLTHLRNLMPALEATLAPEHRVIFVDDCTPPEKGSKAILEFLGQAVDRHPTWLAVRSDANRGFSASNNLGSQKGDGEFICLLNSDTVPQAGWLEAMLLVMDTYPQIGAVGAKLLFPPWSNDPVRPAGTIQHAGVVFNAMRMPYHIFAGWPADHPKVNRHLFMQACTGACLLVRRALWEKVGGLDEAFGQGNFEDIDLTLKFCGLGYEIAYCPDAVLYHWGSGSENVAMVEKNAMLFSHKWGDKITSDDWKYY